MIAYFGQGLESATAMAACGQAWTRLLHGRLRVRAAAGVTKLERSGCCAAGTFKGHSGCKHTSPGFVQQQGLRCLTHLVVGTRLNLAFVYQHM